MKNNKLADQAKKLVENTRNQSIISEERNRLGDKYQELTKANAEILKNRQLNRLISEKLCEMLGLDTTGEGIEKFKSEHPQKYSEMTCSSVSTDSVDGITYVTSKIPEKDPSYFHPLLDEWVLHDAEFAESDPSHKGEYKFTVECVKQCKYISGFFWEPSLYSTDWFTIE